MPDGLITSRPLQNETTGIDLQVPLFQEVRGSMMTGHVQYQIVVVTRLAAFKSAKHRPADVVQLVVSKKYSEMEELYCRLAACYPAVPLPAMPRKALLVGETEIRERRAAFDELVKFLSRHRTLATCPELLGFLGAKMTEVADKTRNVPDEEEEEDRDAVDFFQTEEVSTAELTAGPKVKTKPVTPVMPAEEEEEEEEEVLDPLGILRSRKPKKGLVADAASQLEKPAAKPAAKPAMATFSLFDDEVDPDEDLFGAAGRPEGGQAAPSAKGSSLRLFEDPDLGGAVNVGDSLLLPTAYEVGGGGAKPDEDVEELFRVEDTLDKLLMVSKGEKPALSPKPPPKPKPALPKKPTSVSQNSAALVAGPASVSAPEAKIQTMGQMDILRYIQQNEATTGDDLDLF
ncbi:HCLS1-binding protein 3 isoform X2 [Brienomyrus brachyistius]|uniref:HCLS1-binding protein 3 isoform X2 n=1 Tax=Brienomyrus brachyistius TaxID=42636 RepID=UPI0020B2331F|nr:HCLS1-binding protein 3 isoform X2 [Brienomyrus brachyistius]